MADTELIVRIAAQDAASRNIKNLQSSIIRLVGAVASLAAAFKAITFPVQESVAFEKSLREIQKTTEFTDDAVISLGNSLRELSKVTGVAATDLADIAARAGQLGLGREGQAAILAFTDTISRFAVVADLSVDEAATSIAKIANIFQIPIDQSERVSAAFNELSNTTAATADQLIDVVRRVGDAAGLLEFTDTLGLAAQALELGQTPEVAGTAIIKTFSNAQVKAEEFARVLNITTQEWATAVQTDGVGAIQNVASAIAKLGTLEQGNLIKELFGGGRQFAFGAKLVQDAGNNFNILARTLDTATKSFADATSAQREYDRLTDSTARQTEILQARFSDLALTFGDKLLPVVRNVVDRLNVFLEDDAVQGRILAFGDAVAEAAESFVDFVAAVASGEETFVTFFNIVKAFVALGLGSVAISITGAIVRLGARIGVLGAVFAKANVFGKGFSNTLKDIAAGASFASIAAGKTASSLAASTAAGLTKVNALTGAQITLQARRNQLEKAFSVTRARIVREGVQQARNQGQSVAAQGARARAIITQVNKGVAVKGADRAILKNLDTQVRGINLSLIKAETAAGKASKGFRGFGTIIKGIGGTIFRFITGPIGLLLTVFGGPIFNFISDFFDKGTEAISEDGATMIKAAEDVANELQRVVGVYEEILTKGLPSFDFEFTSDVEDFSKNLSSNFAGIKQLFDGVAGIEEKQRRLTERADRYSLAVVTTNNKISEQEKILERISRIQGPGRIKAQEQAVGVEREIAALNKERDNTNAKLVETEKLAKQAGASVAGLTLTLLDSAARFGEVVNSGEIAVLRQVFGLEKLKKAAEEARREAKLAQDEADKAEGESDGGELQRIADDAATTADSIDKNIAATQASVEAKSKLLRDVILAPLIPIVKGLTEESEEFQKSFFDILARKADVDSFVDVLGGIGGSLLENVAGIVIAEQQIVAFGDLGEKVEATAKSIKGLFDNLDTSARATRARVQSLGRDLDDILVEREIKLEIKRDNEFGAGGFLGRAIDRIQEGAQRRIDRIDTETAAGKRRVRSIERERDARVTALRVQQEDNKQKEQAEALDRARERSIKRFKTLQKELVGVQEALEKAGDPGNDPKAIETQRDRLELIGQISTALNKQFQDIEKRTTAFASFEGTERRDSFNVSAGEDYLVTQDDIKDADAELRVLESELLKIRDDALTKADKVATALESQVSQLNIAASVQKDLTEQVQAQAKAMGTSAGELQLILATYRALRKEVVGDDLLSPDAFTAGQTALNKAASPEIQREFTQFVSTSALDGMTQGINEALAKANVEGTTLQFQLDAANLQEQTRTALEEAPPIKIKVEPVLDGDSLVIRAEGAASGGYISGPGTGTSDSILARLSDGEYVMDAFTTKRFGANFFRTLQRAARTGNPFELPGFAAGGLVGDTTPLAGELRQLGELASRSGSRDEVDLNFNVGGETARLSGDRAEVAKLNRALRSVSRGGAR